jgi:hypothetical protein
MNEEKKRAAEEELTEDELREENLKGAGQRILGNLEIIGGVLTGDPITTAEGEFNDDVGKLHQDSARVLTAIEESEEEKKKQE